MVSYNAGYLAAWSSGHHFQLASSSAKNSAVNFSNFHWFGQPNAKPVEVEQQEITDAPKDIA